MSALLRFREKCAFDPATGCVNWKGGTTSSRARTSRYGAFWYDGSRWTAQHWAAKFIHGLTTGRGWEVRQTCRNSLCVQHIETSSEVLSETERRFGWVKVAVGIDELAEEVEDESALTVPQSFREYPFYLQPLWLTQNLTEETNG